MPLVAVDQVNHTINATILSSLSSNRGGLGEDQSSQNSTESCTDVFFSVFSPFDSEELILYAKGPCKDAELSVGRINIQFLPCTCPIGFQPNIMETTRCVCDCDFKISRFITECYQENKTVVREGTFWISYLNTTGNSSDYEYLIHSQCPLDYCHPSSTKVYINLSAEYGSDEQCIFNRSGILCGKCQSGFSLSLGSSRCIQCSAHWPVVCLAIIIAAFLAGIALVAILLTLNLTVATGTINGIIFYANIVNANRSTFFPFTDPNYITVFTAWLNLELGLDTCFFEGMDMYWKTLLQLAFPIFVIFLVIIVILVSERSTRFAQLIGRKNPVATLDTLILFSYSKLLQTSITALSVSVLEYPDGSRRFVWLSDANINYLNGKHAVLFFTALVIILGGVAYTALLFFWQWIIYYNHKTIFKWVRYHRLYHFIEPYHAPYTFKHRYWTGLLLLVRVVLYLASALNVSGAPGVNLLVTGVVMFSLFLFNKTLYSPIYRKLSVEFLETTCYVNIIFLSFSSFYTLEAKKDQTVVAYISGTITVALFLIVLVYHVFTEICSKTNLWNKLRHNISEHGISLIDHQQAESDLLQLFQPTISWIDAPQREQPLRSWVKTENVTETKLETPLLEEDKRQ